MSKMKPGGALPQKSFYPLAEAANLAGCSVSDLVHYGGQRRVPLVLGVPDGVTLRVYDGYTHALSEPFVLVPQLIALSPDQCQKIELQGRTYQSDFPSGYLLEQGDSLRKLYPSYGRRDLSHQWVYWRLFQGDEVCLLELCPDRLFVTRDDLLALMGEGDEPAVSPPTEKMQKKPRASSGEFVDTATAGSGGGPDAEVVDQPIAGGYDEPVVAESRKTVAVKEKKSEAPVEEIARQSSRGPMILRLKQVMERTGLSRSTVYDRMDPKSPRHDPSFPKQVSLGRAVGWIADEIDAWVHSRIVAGRS